MALCSGSKYAACTGPMNRRGLTWSRVRVRISVSVRARVSVSVRVKVRVS